MPSMIMQLRDYQEAAVQSAISYLNKGIDPLIIAPTGAGKTVIATEIIKRWQIDNGARRCYFVAHRKELLEQAQATLDRNGVDALAISVFSSDYSHISDDDKNNSLIIFDEAHHSVASSWTKFVEIFKGQKVAITATPDRLDRQKLESVGFVQAYEISIRTLIENGHLVRPMAQKMPVDCSVVAMRGFDYILESIADSIVVELNRWDRKKAIAFLPEIDTSIRLVSLLRERGIEAGHADGGVGKFREQTVEDYKNGNLRVLCNVNLFTEGFDAPETDCVILLRPTQSRALWCQMIGRGLRKAEGKTDCLILDPMWLSGENSFTPADAFTLHPFAKAPSRPDSHDPLDLAEKSDRDAEEAMLKRIEREEAKASAKEAKEKGLIDLSVACAVFGYVLPPVVKDESMMTEGQKHELEIRQIYAKTLTFSQARWLIGRLRAREALGLATVKQLRKLKQFRIKGADSMTKESASKAIGSDWRMQNTAKKKFSFNKLFKL